MNSLSLVFKSALQTKAHQIQELKYYQEERSSPANQFAEEINMLNAKNAQDLEVAKQKFTKLQDEHDIERNFLLQTIEANMESHKSKLSDLNSDYESKLKIAYEQRDKLVDEYEQTKSDYKKRLEVILEDNKSALAHIEKEYKGRFGRPSCRQIRGAAEEPHPTGQRHEVRRFAELTLQARQREVLHCRRPMRPGVRAGPSKEEGRVRRAHEHPREGDRRTQGHQVSYQLLVRSS